MKPSADDNSYRTHIAPIASTLLVYKTPVSMLDISHIFVTIETLVEKRLLS